MLRDYGRDFSVSDKFIDSEGILQEIETGDNILYGFCPSGCMASTLREVPEWSSPSRTLMAVLAGMVRI